MQTAERAKAYRDAVDAVEIASARYMELVSERTVREPLADTVEERKAQYRRLQADKAKRLPALLAAGEAMNAACIARDAAFAALKGN